MLYPHPYVLINHHVSLGLCFLYLPGDSELLGGELLHQSCRVLPVERCAQHATSSQDLSLISEHSTSPYIFP